MKIRLAFVFSILSLVHAHGAYAATLKLCSNEAGAIVARSKCKKNEKLVTLSGVVSSATEIVQQTAGQIGAAGETGPVGEVGPVGPTGTVGAQGPTGIMGSTGRKGLTSITPGPKGVLDFSACHKITSGPATSNGQVSLTASCNSQNEFLYEEDWSITGDRAFIQSLSRLSSNGINGETMPYAVSIATSLPAGGFYSLTVSAYCCPR